MTLQERQDSFIEYLKNKHVRSGVLTRKKVDEISNEDFLFNIRHNNEGEEVISVEEFNAIVFENSNNETVDNNLEEIYEDKSVEKRLKNIFDNLTDKIVPIRVPPAVPMILDDLSLCDLIVSVAQVQGVIDDALSIYPEWVYNADNYYVSRGQVIPERTSSNELLLMSLSKYNTFGDWTEEVLNGETDTEGKKLIVKTFGTNVIEVITESMTTFIEDVEKEPPKEFKKLYQDLFNQITRYVMSLPLITVWKGYEKNARTLKEKRDKLEAELIEIAEEKLVPYFHNGVRIKEKSEFLNRLKSVIPSMTREQVVAAYATNFGIDMPKKVQQEFDTILQEAMKKFNENNPG